MKRIMRTMRSGLPVATMILLTGVLFSACKKNEAPVYQPQPAAGLMAFNLALDKSAVGFTLSGNNFGNAALGYTNYSGSYLPIYTGGREVRSFDYTTGSTLAIANGSFSDSAYYSTFLLGANGNYRNVVVEDKLVPLTAANGKAWVRYVNAIPDSSSSLAVSISSGGDNTINEPAAYGRVSDFKQLNSGTVAVAINNAGNIAASRDISLEENKVYTVLFVGLPAQTDSSKNVQIRFIQNGYIVP